MNVTIEQIRAMIQAANESTVRPKTADNGEAYYEVRWLKEGNEIVFNAPTSGSMIDVLTGERLTFE